MKRRTGFVSNSSTSSFCIFGIYVTPHLKSWMGPERQENGCGHKFDRQKMNFCPSCGKPAFTTRRWYYDDYEAKAKAAGLDIVGSDGEYWIGKRVAGKKKANLDELKVTSDLVKQIFGEEAEFITGEYAS